MRIKHFSIFKNNMETLEWEDLRNDQSEKAYFLPYTKEEYLTKVNTNGPSFTTQQILKEIEEIGLKKIFSIGSGIASQEFELKKFSDNIVTVSDYNSSILRLKQFDVFDDALLIDAFKDPLPVDKNWVVLFPRIDTEFNDDQLTQLFNKCYALGVNYICFIPAELLSIRIILAEIKIYLISLIKSKPRVFCGYARSLSSFKKTWEPNYQITKMFSKDKTIIFLNKLPIN